MGSLAKTAPHLTAITTTCSLLGKAEDDADRVVIRQVMDDYRIPQRKVAAWLGCSPSTVADHRGKRCECCGGDAA